MIRLGGGGGVEMGRVKDISICYRHNQTSEALR